MTYYWTGPAREDDTYPQFMVTIASLSAEERRASVVELTQDMLAKIKDLRREWSNGPIEEGTINGLPFARSSWNGLATDVSRKGLSGRQMHGIVYVTFFEQQGVTIMCQDVAPLHAEWLKRGGLAARTFRRAPTKSTSP